MMSANKANPSKRLAIRQYVLDAYKRHLKPGDVVQECQIKFGPRAPTYFTISRWFRRFQSGDLSIEDKKSSGRPKVYNTSLELIEQKIIEDPRITNKMICAEIGVYSSSVSQMINHKLMYAKHAGRYVPRLLTHTQLAARIEHAKNCLALYRASPFEFLERFIAVGELCLLRKLKNPPKEPITSTADATTIDVQTLWATIVWHGKGILLQDFYDERVVDSTAVYFERLERLRDEILGKQPDMFAKRPLIMQDIEALQATNVAATTTAKRLSEMGFEVLELPTQSPDLSPCDFFLFENLTKWLSKRIFETNADVIDCVNKYLNAFNETYFTDGLKQLESRWIRVIELKGHYIDDSF